jgi:hypothetical protein
MTRKNKSEILSNYKLAIKITVTQEKLAFTSEIIGRRK